MSSGLQNYPPETRNCKRHIFLMGVHNYPTKPVENKKFLLPFVKAYCLQLLTNQKEEEKKKKKKVIVNNY